MANNNRNRNTSHNNETWDKNQGRYVDDNNYQDRSNQGYADLDRDGFVGNTGGFYGGTSYTGSNYDDWNNNQYMKPNRPEDRYDNDYRSRGNEGSYKQNQYRDIKDNPYQDYRSYGQYSNYGNEGKRDRGYNDRRSNYNTESGYGSSYGMSNYGNDMSYNRPRYSDWQDDRGNRNNYRSSNRNWNDDQRSNYDRSNRNNDRDWWDKTRDEVASWFGDDDAERRRRMDERRSGEHKGKGPRQYQRSDDRIKEDVCDRLSDDSFIDASDIDVKVEGSEVILSGTVDSRNAKRRAEDLIENLSGVKNVQNNLRVSQPATVGASTIRSTTTETNTKSSTT